MVHGALWLLLTACASNTAPEPSLSIDAEVIEVNALGPVQAPSVTLSDGSVPEGLSWSVRPASVAAIRDGEVHAIAAGEAVVTGRWEQQEVEWRLVVDPDTVIRFVDVPAYLSVGDEVELAVEADPPEGLHDRGRLVWSSSDADLLTVAEGRATAYQPGTVYVTVSDGGSRAQVQLTIR